MKIGIGIDTGGTCTDAVVYQFEKKEILAFGKTPTTKEDLSIGIGKALDQLPKDYLQQAEVIALSTTLATNACVENKGGRAKLIFFGVDPDVVRRVGVEHGLTMDESLIFIDSQTRPNGEVIREPDWDDFEAHLHEWLDDCDAVGVVEMFANKSGAEMEKRAEKLIRKELAIPVVCGHSLFAENNIIRRGASALLNARLISVIDEFLKAVQKALDERNIQAPFVIVRSDGSLMTGEFTATRPVETLLCGPVASVMGAAELTQEENCVVVDIGGTTTDIAFMKNGRPQSVTSGIRIGGWNTFVKGLFVDTFGLGGDSGVIVDTDRRLSLEAEKVMPLCMAAEKYPSLLPYLRSQAEDPSRIITNQKNIYVKNRDITDPSAYTKQELQLYEWLQEPRSLESLKKEYGELIMPHHLQRLLKEGYLIRCGVTPTDVMHVRGDFNAYCTEASQYGLQIMAKAMYTNVEDLGALIYDTFKRKLYCNIVRILVQDAFPELHGSDLHESMENLINNAYDQAKSGKPNIFLGTGFTTPATLVGVGAPTKLFLEDIGPLLGTKVVTSQYSPVANALGAVVGHVTASVTMQVNYQVDEGCFVVSGCGHREQFDLQEEAEAMARKLAKEAAIVEAEARGADPDTVEVELDIDEKTFDAEFGTVYIGYFATATASGNLKLCRDPYRAAG